MDKDGVPVLSDEGASAEAIEQFVVEKEGANLLRTAQLHTINGNMKNMRELAARLGLTLVHANAWVASSGLEFATTDASIILSVCSSSMQEELVQEDIALEQDSRYLLRVQVLYIESMLHTLASSFSHVLAPS